MEFLVKSGNPEKQRSNCLVVGVFESRRLSAAAEQVDQACGGVIAGLLKRGDIEGKPGQALLIPHVDGVAAERILLIGCGRERELDERGFRRAIATMTAKLAEYRINDAVCYLTGLNVKGRAAAWLIQDAARMIAESSYRPGQLKSKQDDSGQALKKITFGVADTGEVAAAEQAVRIGSAVAAGANLARELGDLPPNICTPSYLGERAQELAGQYEKLSAEVLDQAQIEELKMGAFLAVARGSRQPPRLIVLHYKGAGDDKKPVVLVGKGITFDSGGISIKPGANMDEMKYDMCGAASVLGTLRTCAELDLNVNVVGVIPACENLPDGAANKPGDILTSMSGLTIEVLNTDAEGRLILCDALTYSERFEPDAVIDIATLTGACVIALGHQVHGLMGNDPALVNEILAAGQKAGDRAWELPLLDEYKEALESNFADVANVGDRAAGAITAASFLSRFTEKYRWAHLDIAGTAWKSGKDKGASGRPVPLLTQLLLERAAKD